MIKYIPTELAIKKANTKFFFLGIVFFYLPHFHKQKIIYLNIYLWSIDRGISFTHCHYKTSPIRVTREQGGLY